MQTISFNLRQNEEPFNLDFDKVDRFVFHDITRIMDIENYQKPLTIEVDYELYREIKGFLCSEHWMIDFNCSDPNVLPIKLNGFELLFKIKIKHESS